MVGQQTLNLHMGVRVPRGQDFGKVAERSIASALKAEEVNSLREFDSHPFRRLGDRMKHTIAGKHGHHYQLLDKDEMDPSSSKFFRMKKICISAQEAARSDFMSMEIELREKLSLKWNVCMWCWRPSPKFGLYAHRRKGKSKKVVSKLIAIECDPVQKCPAWIVEDKNSRRFKPGA